MKDGIIITVFGEPIEIIASSSTTNYALHQMPGTPMSRYLSSCEHTRCTTQQDSCADRKQELVPHCVFADEPKHIFVVHQRLLPITTGHEQNIKYSRFRNAHIRRNSKPYFTHGLNSFPDDLSCCVRHARKNLKRSSKVKSDPSPRKQGSPRKAVVL